MEGVFKRLLGNCKSGINTLKKLEGSFEIIADKKTDKRAAAVANLSMTRPPSSGIPRASSSSSSSHAQGPGLALSSSSKLRSQSLSQPPPRDPTFISELGAGGTVMGVERGMGALNLSRSTLGTPTSTTTIHHQQLRFKLPARAAKELLSEADQSVADAVLASTTRTSFSRGDV